MKPQLPALALMAVAVLFPEMAAAEGVPQVRRAISIPAQNPAGIAAKGSRMWVTDAGTREVLELDASTGKLVRKFALDLRQPVGLAFDGRRLWVADQASRQIVAYDAVNGRRVRMIPENPTTEKSSSTITALGWDGKSLWTATVGDASPTFNQVDTKSGRITHALQADCEPRGVAFDSGLLFALCWNRDRYLAGVNRRQISSQVGEMRKSVRMVEIFPSTAPAGLAYDGTKLWVLDARRKQAFTLGASQDRPLSPYCEVTTFSSSDVSWNICLTWAGEKGIWISNADIKRTATEQWIRVLDDSGPAEILTAYHDNPVAHLFDMNPWACLAPLTPSDAGSGTLLTVPTSYTAPWCTNGPNVVRENRDRGIAYLCKDFYSRMSRGQEVVYWSVFDPGNYDFIVEYGFRDDGTITFRMGATGYNNPTRPWEAHMHNALWRVHPDIGGLATSNVFVKTHAETNTVGQSLASDSVLPVQQEGAFDFAPQAFTTLRFEGTSTNAFTHRMGYDLVPLVQGSSRHFNNSPASPTEQFAQHDFFVTKVNSSDPDIGAPTLGPIWYPDDYLFANPQLETVTNTDVILWYRSSAHHMPSAEDSPNWPGHTNPGFGITLVHWMGFDLVPHDFFDFNPLPLTRTCGSCGDGVCNNDETCCTCPIDCAPPGSAPCC
jgi:primary-amine oxidase